MRLNCENLRKARKDSRTGLLGASWAGYSFVATIQVRGKKKHLGSFATAEEAHAAYLEAKRKLHEGCTI